MGNARLFELLKSLTGKELKELETLIRSPAINRDEKIIKLFECIVSGGKQIDSISKIELKKAAFDSKEVKDVYFRVIVTSLVKIVERYLVEKKLREDYLRNNLYLLQILRERKCKKGFNTHVREISKQLQTIKEKDAYFYIKRAELKAEQVLFSQSETTSDIFKDLQEIDRDIELSYITFKLDLYFKLLVLEISGTGKLETNENIKLLLERVEKEIIPVKKDHTIIYIKYLALKMIMEINGKGDEYYGKLKKYIRADKYSTDTMFSIYQSLLTYCNIKRNIQKKHNFAKEEFKMYQQMLNISGTVKLNELKNVLSGSIDIVWFENLDG